MSAQKPVGESTSEGIQQAQKTLERLQTLALETAKKLGADAAKIATGASYQKRLVVENKQFSLANSLESRSISIVVHKDKKKGSASINTVTEESVKHAVESALALARYSVADEALTFADLDTAHRSTPLPFMFDPNLAESQLSDLQSVMQEVLARLVRDPRVALDRYEMSVDTSFHAMANSHGVKQAETQTMSSWSFFGMARDGEEVTGFDYDGNFSFKKSDVLTRSMADAEAFVTKILGGLKPRKCPSYKGPVLFSPRAVQELLAGMVLFHASGRQVMDGKSRWDKRVGEKVVSDKISLVDLPHDPRFSGTTAFDGDGVPTRRQQILDKGVLVTHLHDVYSAKKCGVKTTGSAGGPFACEFATGKTPLAEAKRAAPSLLIVDRFSGNSDPTTGDFSGVAKGSRIYLNGQDSGAVTETMIAGNFFDIADKILAVSAESEIVGGGFASPYVLIDAISVTGEQ